MSIRMRKADFPPRGWPPAAPRPFSLLKDPPLVRSLGGKAKSRRPAGLRSWPVVLLGGLVALWRPMLLSAELPNRIGPFFLQVPEQALPLETLVPVPEKLRTEPSPKESAWELLPVGRSSCLTGPALNPTPVQQPLPLQAVPEVGPDGQPAEARWQWAVQIGHLPEQIRAKPQGSQPGLWGQDVLRQPVVYRLQSSQKPWSPSFQWKEISSSSLGLWEGEMPILVYNHGPITNPAVPAKDHRRTRACYVHPLYGLRGEVLTDDFPKDHYHHHGIFWAWPHILIEGKEYDLWAGASIRQEFVRWLARQTGPVCAVLGVENGWYVGQKKVMVERIWFWVYRTVGEHHRSIDIALYVEPTDRPITLWGAPEKSYGGLTVRFAPSSRAETEIIVPTGRTFHDLLNTRLQWADFTSRMLRSRFRSGAAMMIHPRHPDYPPTWLTRHYGAMCVGWPGVRPKTLYPGQPIRLQYRLWIHPGPAGLEPLAAAYQAFCAGVEQVGWQEGAERR